MGEYGPVHLSHPAWVCGLKQLLEQLRYRSATSHPAWVCGLKQAFRPDFSDVGVTPCVGVWIETYELRNALDYGTSHPAWVCGLKHFGNEYHKYIPGHTLRGCVD